MRSNLHLKKLLLLGAPLLIAAICSRPAYGNEIHEKATQQYQAAVRYHLGQGVKIDPYKALGLFKQAAELENPDAQFSLGALYENGYSDGHLTVLRKNISEATKWYEKAALQGHTKAQYNLALILLEGYGVNKDPSTAFYWFEKAALQGNTKAQYKLGCAYLEGIGVTKDQVLAQEWLNKAALQGHQDAKIALQLIQETIASGY